jgi:LmbE family N-acetylglucosaminyl deacetylase
MALTAIAVPILPGKTEAWHRFVAELKGPRRAEYRAARRRLGVRERIFLQQSPQGDLVIITVEGADLVAAFSAFIGLRDPFTLWFLEQMRELHGYDLHTPPPWPIPQLAIDSEE